MIREIIGMCLGNHIYTVGGKLFIQLLGGPIGLTLTKILAEIVMREFYHLYGQKLETLNLKPKMNERYVDDLNALTVSVSESQEQEVAARLGEVWERPTVVESKDRRTSRIYRILANTILPNSIQMEESIPEDHIDGYLPILDTKMRLERVDGTTRIRHLFYRKPMASKEVTWARSALTTRNKRDILIQDLVRRLRNSDSTVSQ